MLLLLSFLTEWPKLGIASDIRLCFDHLWNYFMESQFGGVDKHSRPVQKKKSNIYDETLIKKVGRQI
jgi:hypothetical protein